MDAPEPAVTVVLPCLDEAKTLTAVIEQILAAFQRLQIDGEIVVADNGSRDGSPDLAARLGARVVHVAQRGYGHALRQGMRAARGRHIVLADADATYDFGEMNRFLQQLENGADFVIGTRLPPGTILPGANPWLNRHLGTPVLTLVLPLTQDEALRPDLTRAA